MAHRITVKAKDEFRSFKKDYEVVFDFEDTNINFLLGKNGCGKSTLIRAIRGTMNSNDGKIEADGKGWRGHRNYF